MENVVGRDDPQQVRAAASVSGSSGRIVTGSRVIHMLAFRSLTKVIPPAKRTPAT